MNTSIVVDQKVSWMGIRMDFTMEMKSPDEEINQLQRTDFSFESKNA